MAKAQLEIVLKDSGQRIPKTLPAPEERDEATPKPEPTPPEKKGGGEHSEADQGRIMAFSAGAMRAFMGGQGLANSAFAGLATAAGPAGTALMGVTAAAKAVKESFDALQGAIQAEVDRIGHFDPSISVAQSQADIAEMVRDMERAQEMSDDLVGFIQSRAELDARLHELESSSLKMQIELYELLKPLVEMALPFIEFATDSIGWILEFFNDGRNAVSEQVQKIIPGGDIYSLGGIGMLRDAWNNLKSIRNAAETIVDAMAPDGAILDPYMREFMQLARRQRSFGPGNIQTPQLGDDMGA